MEYLISRRHFLKTAGLGAAAAAYLHPLRLAFAATENNKRLLVVIMRGALDGLAAVVPYGDPYYADARGKMALPQDSDTLINLDGYFALHSALSPLADFYRNKQLLIYHAAATSYRERSHFDAQDLLENGGNKPHGINSGWLNRVITSLSPTKDEKALAIGGGIPVILRGEAKVNSWSPTIIPDVNEDFLARVTHMYQSDKLLLDALGKAQEMQAAAKTTDKTAIGPRAFIGMMQKAANFMQPANGAKIAAIDIGGWDTHSNQGLTKGGLAENMKILAEGLTEFQKNMKEAWKDTAVLCITEFGRTVRGNGTGGTDHGTASVAFLLGGSVNGGKIIGDWPGLKKLYEDRDLTPANDLRSLLKSTLKQHLLIPSAAIDSAIFPDSRNLWLTDKI